MRAHRLQWTAALAAAIVMPSLAAVRWPATDMRWIASVLSGYAARAGGRNPWPWRDGPAAHGNGPGWLASVLDSLLWQHAGAGAVLGAKWILYVAGCLAIIWIFYRSANAPPIALAAGLILSSFSAFLPGSDPYLPLLLAILIAATQNDRCRLKGELGAWLVLGFTWGALSASALSGAGVFIALAISKWRMKARVPWAEVIVFFVGVHLLPTGTRGLWQYSWPVREPVSMLLGGPYPGQTFNATTLLVVFLAFSAAIWKNRADTRSTILLACAIATAFISPASTLAAAVLAAPFLAQRARSDTEATARYTHTLAAGFLVLGAISILLVYPSLSSGIDKTVFPVQAVTWSRQNPTKKTNGKTLFDPAAGSLAELAGDPSVFTDYRLARMAPTDSASPMMGVLQGHPLSAKWLDAQAVQRVVASRHLGIIQLLQRTPGWTVVFCDEGGAVVERGVLAGVPCSENPGSMWVWDPVGPRQGRER